jgi:hypothetical protein
LKIAERKKSKKSEGRTFSHLLNIRETEKRKSEEIINLIKIIETGWKYFNKMEVHTNDMPQKSIAASG